ncbi:HD domain-containing protein [Pararcticibacter amylolyticus]|uniref:5'-deoxynucleotidase n=1 Tax=Pararcticibacter amylolyticus TaxID=2173175 RepID=A0A2U2PAB3_9SPHI|nr:HD domain-containing protein [Pararcticibacter amylolyticus]PWG78336.1 phosphohydrolase [Pararcticibacter amylolyticus]
MKFDVLLKQMSFIHEIDKIKYIFRKSRLFSSDRHENDAEHSWHLAMMAIILADYANEPVDVLKVLKMLLIHDIVEIDAGDVFLFDSVIRQNNSVAESKAAERIFGLLPADQAAELIELWQEFEAAETPESLFARAIDNLEPILQNISNGGGTWEEFNVSYETVVEKKKLIQYGSKHLWEFTEDLLKEGLKNGLLKSEKEKSR